MYSPNTTCFPSKKSHLAQVIKNWHPFVSFPLLAFENKTIILVNINHNNYIKLEINLNIFYHRKKSRLVMF